MDFLDNDTTNLILQQVPVLDRLQLYKVLNIPKPSQFQVSSELIASKDFHGDNGLIMRARTTGEYEPSVQAIMIFFQNYTPEDKDVWISYWRKTYVDLIPLQRAEMVTKYWLAHANLLPSQY